MQKVSIIILFCLFIAESLLAQRQVNVEDANSKRRSGSSVLDDSTKQIYGPTTTSFTYEHNIKYNLTKTHFVDTVVNDYHKWQFVARDNNMVQNLGNVGTAYAPLYPQMPYVIGARLGFNIYDRYYTGSDDIKVYNTKSPYSKFGFVWGGKGRSMTEAAYTRNIDERSNIGFEYRGILIDKQIERERRGDRHALGTYYNFHGNYATKNGKYFALANFSRQNHVVDEYGGITLSEDSLFQDFFEENRQGNLSAVETRDLRTNYHLYQQYKVNDQIQFYHSHDRFKQFNDFTNEVSSGTEADAEYFGIVALDTIPVKDRIKIISRQHEVGFKGDIGKTFYSFYYRGREVNVDYKYLDEGELDFGTYYMENYVGGSMRFGNDSTSYIAANAEYMLKENNYKLGASIQNSWFYAEAKSAQYLPSYTQRAYLGRHDQWLNDFDPTINTKIIAGLNGKFGNLRVSPEVGYNLISNYVYFAKLDIPDTVARPYQPTQAGGDISIITGQAKASYTFLKRFTIHGQLVYSEVAGDNPEAVNLPQLLINGQLVYHNIFYNGNLELQFGVDFHQRSAYFANGYDPSIMQFYVQNEIEVEPFPIIDIFLNIKINRGRAFLKMNNIYERIKGTGYFLTPYYPAQTTILDFGLDWILFD